MADRIEISFLETFICSAFAACFAEVSILSWSNLLDSIIVG